MIDLVLPALPGGAARVVRWLAAPNDDLEAGAPLLLVQTARVEAALPAPAGTLAEIVALPGVLVATGGLLARLASHDERQPSLAAGAQRVYITPLARRVAAVHQVELAVIRGSGPGGRVGKADVLALLPAKQAAALLPAAAAPPRAADGWGGRPIATAMVEADMSAALATCAAFGPGFARLGLALPLSACVAQAAAGLLAAHPALNGSWSADGIVLRRRLHLAVGKVSGAATAPLQWALVRDAGDLALRGVARALCGAGLPGSPDEATFAMASLAEGTAWQAAPPLPPNVLAALGVGAPQRRPVVRDQRIAIRPISALALSYDARAIDHDQAAAFLGELRTAIECFRA